MKKRVIVLTIAGITTKQNCACKIIDKTIQKKVGGGSKLDKMYEHIKKSFHSLITKHESESTKKQSAK